MNVVVFAGAGTSADLGVPAMRPMLEQFFDHLRDLALPANVIKAIEQIVVDPVHDMEYAIDLIDRIEAGRRAEQEFGREFDPETIIPNQTIRGEAEWFVQHCCEQIKAPAAAELWRPLLRTATQAANIDLTIGTTNYDRAIEIAGSRTASAQIHDGFEEFNGREFAQWTGSWPKGGIALHKLHGSTDWYRGEDDRIIKLRHPMPLFGGLRVVNQGTNSAVESALVLPSREKVVTHAPFQDISFEFRKRAQEADILIFVGSSLRDPHIRSICKKHAPEKPTFAVSRSGNFSSEALPLSTTVIRESAARFLISTLPRFLMYKNQQILEKAAASSSKDEAAVLPWMVIAKDERASTRDRCDAIEQLADAGVSLLKEEIVDLLNSTDAEVSIFALGLVQQSEERTEIITIAEAKSANAPDGVFSNELALLRVLI